MIDEISKQRWLYVPWQFAKLDLRKSDLRPTLGKPKLVSGQFYAFRPNFVEVNHSLERPSTNFTNYLCGTHNWVPDHWGPKHLLECTLTRSALAAKHLRPVANVWHVEDVNRLQLPGWVRSSSRYTENFASQRRTRHLATYHISEWWQRVPEGLCASRAFVGISAKKRPGRFLKE